MGYACPVCETPQRDGEHLANHLAFTAMLRGGDHEAWLSETVPEWEGVTPAALADAVVDHAPAAEYDEVFEDTTTDGHDHDHSEAGGRGQSRGPGNAGRPTPSGRGYDETADEAVLDGVVAEARQLTAEMYGLDGADGDETAGDGTTGDETAGDETTGDETDDDETDTASDAGATGAGETAGDETDDDETAGDETTGDETTGDETDTASDAGATDGDS